MRWIGTVCLVLLAASSAMAGPFYIHSQGHKVELTPAPDRIAVTLVPSAREGLTRVEGVDASGQMLRGPDGMTTILLDPEYRGMGEVVAGD